MDLNDETHFREYQYQVLKDNLADMGFKGGSKLFLENNNLLIYFRPEFGEWRIKDTSTFSSMDIASINFPIDKNEKAELWSICSQYYNEAKSPKKQIPMTAHFIYHVRFKCPVPGGPDFYFGSLAAIFDQFRPGDVGVGLKRLYSMKVAQGETFEGAYCTIKQSRLVRKQTKRGKID